MPGSVTGRIDSIDALRAFALLGILLVHAVECFGFHEEALFVTSADNILLKLINNVFLGRSNAIFSLLFGCSFWFLLRNPAYSSLKFVWRCILLACIGVVAKLFFTFDVLMWYGMWGAVLVLFRHFRPHWLLVLSAMVLLSSSFVESLHIADIFHAENCPDRYVSGYNIGQVIDYPLTDSFRIGFASEFHIFSLRTFGLMLLGYWIGCKGYITRWREVATVRLALVLAAIVIGLFVFVLAVRGDGSSLLYRTAADMLFVLQALFMSVLMMLLCRNAGRWIYPLACYGRLGLTNYFFQGVFGVILFCEWFIPHGVGLACNVVILLVFYVLQMIFSVLWCCSHRYGPLEWLWRKATALYPSSPTTACRKA